MYQLYSEESSKQGKDERVGAWTDTRSTRTSACLLEGISCTLNFPSPRTHMHGLTLLTSHYMYDVWTPTYSHTHTHTTTQHMQFHILSYSHLFNTGLNQITCKTCDTFKVQVDAERDKARLGQLHGGWELHLCKAKRLCQQLKEDSALGKSDPIVLVITFDLHNLYQLQSWPLKSSSSCGPTLGNGFSWSTGDSLMYLSSPTANYLITHSDSYGGQNRNVYLLSLWLHTTASDVEFAEFMTVDLTSPTTGTSAPSKQRDATVILSSYLKSGLSSSWIPGEKILSHDEYGSGWFCVLGTGLHQTWGGFHCQSCAPLLVQSRTERWLIFSLYLQCTTLSTMASYQAQMETMKISDSLRESDQGKTK